MLICVGTALRRVRVSVSRQDAYMLMLPCMHLAEQEAHESQQVARASVLGGTEQSRHIPQHSVYGAAAAGFLGRL
jgi:hypothetical protein